MRKIIAVLLSLCLLFNIFGFYTVYLISRRIVKAEMKQYIRELASDAELEIISPDPDAMRNPEVFKWIEQGEFRYKGKMYDVVRTEVNNGRVYYYCVNDTREEAVMHRFELAHHQSGSCDPVKTKSSRIINQIIKDFFFPQPENPDGFQILELTFHILKSDIYCGAAEDTFHPPELIRTIVF